MERLTTDTPTGNFETILNFVHSKDGWAHIYDSDGKEVNLITWAFNQCHDRGCDDFQCKTLEEYDEALSSCMMDFMGCPVAMAYCFASQAVHLRTRLKMYEDIMSLERVQELAQAEKDGRLAVLPENAPQLGIPVPALDLCDVGITSVHVNALKNYGKTWIVCRLKPEDVPVPTFSEAEEKRAIVQRLKDYRAAHGLGSLEAVSAKTAYHKGKRLSAETLRDICADGAPKMPIEDWRKIGHALDELEAAANG